MTARDDLRTALLEGWKHYNPERAQLLIDAYTHELAERIRAECNHALPWSDVCRGCEVADFIDSEEDT